MQDQDHDILIAFRSEMNTKMERAITDIKELKDNVASRVSDLELEKANIVDVNQLKEEFKPIRDNFNKIIGGLILLQALEGLVLYILLHH